MWTNLAVEMNSVHSVKKVCKQNLSKSRPCLYQRGNTLGKTDWEGQPAHTPKTYHFAIHLETWVTWVFQSTFQKLKVQPCMIDYTKKISSLEKSANQSMIRSEKSELLSKLFPSVQIEWEIRTKIVRQFSSYKTKEDSNLKKKREWINWGFRWPRLLKSLQQWE